MSDATPKPSPNLPKACTPEKLQELLSKHGKGKLFPVSVTKDGNVYTGLFKKPSLAIIDAGTSTARDAAGVDPMKLMDFVYTNCKVMVDEEIETDDELKSSMRNGVFTLFKTFQAQVGEALG